MVGARTTEYFNLSVNALCIHVDAFATHVRIATTSALTCIHSPKYLQDSPHSTHFNMGSAQSLISAEAALTAAVVAGAIGLGYSQYSHKPNVSAQDSATPPPGAKKGKKKKPASQSDSTNLGSTSSSQVGAPDAVPGQFDPTTLAAPEDTPVPKPKKGKKKKGKAINDTATTVSSADNRSESSAGQSKHKSKRQSAAPSQLTKPLKQSTTSIDTDGSWTRVESRRRTHHETASVSGEGPSGPSAEVTNSDAGATTSATGNSSPVAERTEDEAFILSTGEHQRTLAERLLPKPRKTGVAEYVLFLFLTSPT